MSTSRKFFATEKTEVNESERTITAYITTEAIDRDREVVLAAGADLDNYRKNPVVLWGHDYHGTPVGKNLWIRSDGRGLLAKTQYATTPKAEEIWQLRKGGFLKGYSIGFIPKQGKTADGLPYYGPPVEKELKVNPHWKDASNVVRGWEMVEYSDAPVPCNPEALERAYQGKSITLSPDTARQLELDELPAPQAPRHKVYTEAEYLEWAFWDYAQQQQEMMKHMREILAAEVPVLVKECLHVARGGV